MGGVLGGCGEGAHNYVGRSLGNREISEHRELILISHCTL